MKKFFQEFKKFITRGNVMDLAVGVIVGAAFTAIVTALTNNIIRPFINWIIALIGGKDGLSSVYTFLQKTYTTDVNGEKIIDLKNSIYIDWGAFITAILDFFIIAFTVFIIVKAFNASREKFREFGDMIEEQTKKEVILERKAIRLKAKQENKKFNELWEEHLAEKKRMNEEKARILAEDKKKKEEELRRLNPTQEDLLKEIRDILKDNNDK